MVQARRDGSGRNGTTQANGIGAAAGHWIQGPTLWRRLQSMAVLEVEMSQLLDPDLKLSRRYSITSLGEIDQIIGSDAKLVR